MKKFNYKKGQTISFDLSSSIIIFVIFIVMVIGSFFLLQRFSQDRSIEFELEYVFANFENNLKFDPLGNDFLVNYRVDKTKLDNFATTFTVPSVRSIDSYVVGSVEYAPGIAAHGIGLDEYGYDTCLYFIDTDGSKIEMQAGLDTVKALGTLKDDPLIKNCNTEISNDRNPCDGYKRALSLFKPVLYDVGDPDNNRIISMNLVICKI